MDARKFQLMSRAESDERRPIEVGSSVNLFEFKFKLTSLDMSPRRLGKDSSRLELTSRFDRDASRVMPAGTLVS
jgi:hypothetical protein